MKAATDESLMRAYQKGDEKAFGEIYQRYAPRLLGYLLKKVGNRALSEELLQVIFLKLHQSRHLYESKLPFSPWLFTIGRNVLIDAARRGQVFQQSTLESFDEKKHDHGAEPEGAGSLESAPISELSASQRELIEWRFLDESSYSEIAARLATTEVSARKRVSRAVNALKLLVKGKEIKS